MNQPPPGSAGGYPGSSGAGSQFQEFFNQGNGGFTFRTTSFGGPGGSGSASGGGFSPDILQDMMGQFFGGSGGGFNFGSFGGGGGSGGGFNFGGSQPSADGTKQKRRSNQQSSTKENTSKSSKSDPAYDAKKENKDPIVVKVDCTLEDLYKGVTKNMKVKNDVASASSSGKPSSSMGDKKKKPIEKTFPVEVKAGYKKGTKINFPSSQDFPRKVVFEINQVPHRYFERIGDDLKWICKLTQKQLEKGVKVKVPLLDGETLVVNTRDYPQIKDGTRLPFEGKGMPSSKNPDKKGSLIIKFQVTDGAESKD